MRKAVRYTSLFIFCMLIFFNASTATAGINQWTSTGPYGGQIGAVALDPVNPTTLYVGTYNGGIFKSIDGGNSWNRLNIGVGVANVYAIVINPKTSSTLFASIDNGSVLRSMDGGNSWSRSYCSSSAIQTLAIDPITPTTIYAGTSNNGIYKSSDNGNSWIQINSGLTSMVVFSIAVDPKASTTLYAGASTGVFKSSNAGETWNSCLPASNVQALAIDPVTPATIYAGTRFNGVFKSSDSGASWRSITTGLSATYLTTLAIDPAEVGTIYACYDDGIAKSTNGGNNWNEVYSHPSAGFKGLAIVPTSPSTLYVGTYKWGVYKSTNGGVTLTQSNSGLLSTAIFALAIDPATPATLYAGGVNSGTFKSADGGGSWQQISTEIFPFVLAVDPITPSKLYAGTSNGVFRSSDAGGNWSQVNNGITNPIANIVLTLAIDPIAPTTIYAGTVYGGGVYKSTNGGDTWVQVNNGLTTPEVYAFAIDPTKTSTLFAGTYGGGVFKSTNGGDSWSQINTGLTGLNVTALTVDPTAPNILYAGTDRAGIFKSTNGGVTWRQLNYGLTSFSVNDIIVDPASPTTLYAGTTHGGIFRSINGGENWTQLGTGLTDSSILRIVIDPTDPATIYAGSNGTGVSAMTIISPPTGTITGKVTNAATGAGIPMASVSAYDMSNQWVGYGSTDSTGSFSINGLLSGRYKVAFYADDYLGQWYDTKADQASATAIEVTAPQVTAGIDAALSTGGRITGIVTDGITGAGISGINVVAYDAVTGSSVAYGSTTSTGVYDIPMLSSGTYKLSFSGSGYLARWYGGADISHATVVTVTAPNSTAGINVVLAKGGSISGKITDSTTGLGIGGIGINAFNTGTGSYIGYGYSNSDGGYTVTGLPTGEYKLHLFGSEYVDQWYGGQQDRATADVVTVSAPATTTDINVAMVKGGGITGRITDKITGADVKRFTVRVYDISTGTTASHSYNINSAAFTISGLRSGTYKVSFSSPDYITRWYGGANMERATIVTVTAPNSTTGIDAALERGGAISGTVTDKSTGAGIAGVYVNVRDASASPGSSEWYGGYTDTSGAYSVTGLPTGRYKLSFSAPGYPLQWYGGTSESTATVVTVTAPDATTGANGVLTRGGSIAGTITDSTGGAGIPSAQVTAYDTITGEWMGSTSTDANGDYTISGLQTGTYHLSFTAGGYFDRWYDNRTERGCGDAVTVTAPSTTLGVNASLLKGGSISGRVTDAVTGAGIAGVSIYLSQRSGTGIVSGSPVYYFMGSNGAVTDANGDYTVSDLATGDYAISFSADGYVKRSYGGDDGSATLITVTAPGAVRGIDATLVRGGAISGRLTDSVTGAGIAGLWVYAYDAVSNSYRSGTETDTTGAYRIDGLPTGSYKLQFQGRQSVYADSWYNGMSNFFKATTISVTAPAVTAGIDSVLRRSEDGGGSISGKVTDRETGAPASWLPVEAVNSESGRVAYGYTDATGVYTVSDLTAGTYKVNFRSNYYISRWFPDAPDMETAGIVTVRAYERTNSIDMALRRGGRISGTVIASTCPSPGSFRLIAYDASTGAKAGETWVTPEYSGIFAIGGLPSGSYKIEVDTQNSGFVKQWYNDKTDSAGADSVAVTAPNATEGLEVHLVPGATVTGRVTDTSGSPVPYMTVTAYDALTGNVVAMGNSSPSGTYSLRGLPAGGYKIFFAGNIHFRSQWYKTQPDLPDASVVSLTASESVDRVNVVVSRSMDWGDVNGDGRIDLADPLLVLRINVGLVSPSADNYIRGDVAPLVDGVPSPDGSLDLSDAVVLLRRVVGDIQW